MRQEEQVIEKLIQQCVLYFEQSSFTKSRIDRFRTIWKNGIISYMLKRSLCYYDASVGEEFLRTQIGKMAESLQKDTIRSINILNDIQKKGTISKRHCNPCKLVLSGQIGQLMEDHCSHLVALRRHKKTVRHHRLNLYRLLVFLESKQIFDVKKIKEEHIIEFVSTLTNNNVSVVSYIRVFFKYLFENQILSHDLSEGLKHYHWKRKAKLPSVYSAQEVLQIESSIKRENSVGRRNYAMLLLATRLGLRASDIANMTFNNINWECNKITLVQSKTCREIDLPLLADVGEAIIDYLKYGRKKSTLPQIFLYTRAPYAALTGDAVSASITHLIEVSGVDTGERKHGAHSMRHSLASRFLENKEPLPVISQALGHQESSSTMFYLRIDVESLRQCALDTPLVSDRFYEQKGGFYEY